MRSSRRSCAWATRSAPCERRNICRQAQLAKLMGLSQSGGAKVENRDPEDSLDLQMKAVIAASPGARREFEGLIRK